MDKGVWQATVYGVAKESGIVIVKGNSNKVLPPPRSICILNKIYYKEKG